MSGKKIKKSVLVITERYYPEKFLINDLISAWIQKGFKVIVLTQVPSYPADSLFSGYKNEFSDRIENGARIVRFKTVLGYKRSLFRKILSYFCFMIRALWYSLRLAYKVDSVFVYHTGPLTQALPLITIKLLTRKRTAIWTQDVWPDTVFAYGFPNHGAFAILVKAFVYSIYTFCDVILVSSPGFIQRLRPYVAKHIAIQFLPQWVSDEVKIQKPTSIIICSKAKRFIFAGNLGKMQNLDKVILAFAKITPQCAELYLLGDGSNRSRLEALVSEHHIKNVVFLGSVPQDQVISCLQQCDFTVLSLSPNPLISLTIPAKFQTYLFAQKPIFAITDGEVAKLVHEHGLGVTANPSSIDSIVEGVRSMCSITQNQRYEIEVNLYSLLIEKYNKERSVENAATFIFG
ncbi:MAG TPA: glycosyltransferase WbuB [Spirochaetaceae bacterium]|nr:glycosyltransferase WbuB [Spirochaetaceae bacterium]HBO41209.1 glycosyltransferase WbuB [Spirochaetaceae bacterium]